jgi:hypothetical protein
MAVPFEKNSVFAWSYVFTLIAMAMQIAVWHYAWSKDSDIQSKFYGIPILLVGSIYLIAQVLLGLVFMILAVWVPLWVPVVLYVVLLGAMLIGCIGADIARSEVQRVGQEQEKDTSFIKILRAETEVMDVSDLDGELAKTIMELKEQIRYSDPVSSASLKEAEDEMRLTLHFLKNALKEKQYDSARQYAGQLITETKRRNALCRVMKQ